MSIYVPSVEERAAWKPSVDELIQREQACGQALGPYHRAWVMERAPEKIHKLLRKAKERPDIVGMPAQLFSGATVVPPFSHTAINTTTTITYLWIPGLYSSVAYGDPYAGKAYEVQYGGIVSTSSSAPTAINTLEWDGATTSAIAGTAVSLGASTTITMTASLANVPFYGSAIVVFRSLALAATSSTCVASGATVWGGAAAAASVTAAFGTNSTATVDTYTQSKMGVGLGWTWGTSAAANTITCQYIVFGSLN